MRRESITHPVNFELIKEPLRVVLQAALDAGDFAQAPVLCHERLREAPEDADAHRHLAQLQAAQGLWDYAGVKKRRKVLVL